VPLLLLIGNKMFGISSSLRHICAACFPANVKFFRYDWKKESWNLFFVGGITAGGLLAAALIPGTGPVNVHPDLANELRGYGITDLSSLVPRQIFGWEALFSARSLVMMIGGGFLVGFGTRYAGGCTSGHAISGISSLQWPSLIATVCFMAGGFLMANVILPLILSI
jgi:uncharacterized protein